MKISRSQLKEQIRAIVREALNSEQFAPLHRAFKDTRSSSEHEQEDDMITFFDNSGNPDKKPNKARQKQLADQWQSEQDDLK
jgi:hypothetical protein